MPHAKQAGSAHVVIIIGLAVALITALGVVAWQNIGPGKKDSPETTQNTKIATKPNPDQLTEPQNLAANSTSAQANIWSGYVAHSKTFTEVEGRVKVPKITCDNPSQAFTAWVGFDGWHEVRTVEQAGVTAECGNASMYVKTPPIDGVYYSAWAAMHDAGGYEIFDFAVRPGDSIYSKISYSDNIFTLSVTNETTGKTGTSKQRCVVPEAINGPKNCPRTYAEWIVERPGSSEMADFGTVRLYDNTATTADGKQMYPETLPNMRVDMIQAGTPLALSLPLIGKGSFDVTWATSGKTGE